MKQECDFIYVVGIPIPHPFMWIETSGHGLALCLFNESADIFYPPGRYFRTELNGLWVTPIFDACPPGGLAYGIDFENIRQSNKAGFGKRLHIVLLQ